MKHHRYNLDFNFVKEPIEFNKYTEREILQYCLGATLYMPGNKDVADSIIKKKLVGLTSMVMCFEDAISEETLPEAEDNVISFLNIISQALNSGYVTNSDIPLFFFRVRNPDQFKKFTDRLNEGQIKVISGFVFPKFNTSNGYLYMTHLKSLNNNFNDTIYGMPILESSEIAFKETRVHELTGLKNLLKPFRDLILNIRVGATDFSSKFGVRRGIDYSIYDILP